MGHAAAGWAEVGRADAGGVATEPIPARATASQVRLALEALPTVGTVAVAQSPEGGAYPNGESAYTVTFTSDLGNLPELGFDALWTSVYPADCVDGPPLPSSRSAGAPQWRLGSPGS